MLVTVQGSRFGAPPFGLRPHKQGSGFKGSLNSEPQNRRIMNRRMSKGGFALLSLFYKIDRSTTEAHDGQNTFLRHSTFMIRYSIFIFLWLPPTLVRKAEVFFSINPAVSRVP